MEGGGVNTLTDLLAEASQGRFPAPDAGLTILPQPSPRDAGIIAFTAHNVIFADVEASWIRDRLPGGDLSAPLNPPFLSALEERMGRPINNVDMLALAEPLGGRPSIALTETAGTGHPRVELAHRYRDAVRAWTCPGGLLVVGRGVAGRWEAAIEVEPEHQGRGLGRALACAARRLTPHPLWAQIAPGNAASVRAFLAAGYVPVGAEALFVP